MNTLPILGDADTAPRNLLQLNAPQAEGLTRDREVPPHHSVLRSQTSPGVFS